MSKTVSYERKLLAHAFDMLEALEGESPAERSEHDHRFLLLEATSATIGGFNVDALWSCNGGDQPSDASSLVQAGKTLADFLQKDLTFHPSLALATLAAPDLSLDQQRREGVYYTDSRLARFLAQGIGSCEKS